MGASTVDARLDDAGDWSFGAGTNEWHELAALPPDAFAALQDAIRASGILDTAPEHRPPTSVIGSSTEHWTVDLDGRRAATVQRGLPEVRVAAVTAVADALHAALAAADRG